MKLYAFELGRNKDLCFAELVSVLGEKNLAERNLDTAVFLLNDRDWQKLQNRLGGTIKIVEILEKIDNAQNQDRLKQTIEKILIQTFEGRSGKIPFSLYLLGFKNIREINSKELLNFSKKILKSLGLNSRFVNKNFKNPKPSTIYKARVIEKGIDLNIIKGTGGFFLGQTVTIQDIDNYSKRDYNKPRRDAAVGMLPPKLAQIMINISGGGGNNSGGGGAIFDPFCGTGTILMEGMLMGLNVVGSDIDPRMIQFSQENCEWLNKEFDLSKADNFRVFERDARFLNKKVLPENISAIITEGYLGKPLTQIPSQEEKDIIFRELANLHLNWLISAHNLLSKDGLIVMCTTGYKIGERIEHFPHFNEIVSKAGYKIIQTFTYSRPDQIVVRDIKILKKI